MRGREFIGLLGGTRGRSLRHRYAWLILAAGFAGSGMCSAQSLSPNGVKTLSPPGAIKAEGTWSLGARAGDLIFVAGMQGVDPVTTSWCKII
jgi:hypothetical protein